MSDETRDKLKDLVKKKPLNTAVLTTPEYDQGRNDAIDAAMRLVITNQGHFGTRGDVADFRNKLESLKKPRIE